MCRRSLIVWPAKSDTDAIDSLIFADIVSVATCGVLCCSLVTAGTVRFYAALSRFGG